MRGIITSIEKISDRFIRHAGDWHHKHCDFPTEDRAVCNCKLAMNRKTVRHMIENALQAHQAFLKEKIEEYFGHIENDGIGKPMNISQENIAKDILSLLDQPKP